MTQLPISLNNLWQTTYRATRRLVIAILGSTVFLLGVVLIITPGPAIVVIPLGLAILATEFIWARRLLKRLKSQAQSTWDALKGRLGVEGGDGKPA